MNFFAYRYGLCSVEDSDFDESKVRRTPKGDGGGQFAKKPETLAKEDERDVLSNKQQGISVPDSIPTEEEIKSGGATFMGTPLRYVPGLHEEANHDHDDEIIVSDKFFQLSEDNRREILVHEKCHEFSDKWLKEVWTKKGDAAKPFIKWKKCPRNPDEEYVEGINGFIGGNALSEATTDCMVWYLLYPEHLKKRSMDFNGDNSAWESIAGFMEGLTQ